MYSALLKHTVMFLFTIYTTLLLLNKIPTKIKECSTIIVLSSCLGLITKLAYEYSAPSLYFAPLLILWFVVSLLTTRPQFSLVIISVAFGINYCLQAISGFFATLIYYPLMYDKENYSLLFLSILSSIIHSIFILALFQIKRLRKGLPLLNMSNYIHVATAIALFFICLPIYSLLTINSDRIKLFFFICFIFLYAFLIFWWQAQITKSYKQRLLMSELEARRISDPQKDAEIERLSTILHRNTNLINALRDATINGLRTDFESEEEQIETRKRLIANIEKLSADCENVSSDYRRKKARTFDTKLPLLDDLLHRLDGDAIEQEITFQVYLGVTLTDYVPTAISESDLTYTVNDLLRNAFKATRTCEKRIVQLQLYRLGKYFVVEVSDNGIPFEVRSLVNMGLEKLTTYEDGSGIGLVDIWKTKEHYGATYHLEEVMNPAPFSKKISLTFDKKNRYTIRTWRKDDILKKSRRADLQVYNDKQ